ncbi:MAG: hypothetical protein N3A61_06715 [Ignavibacteria bacterium]|nr:hypothetical protein [Ignavibacteria bacterium]
MKIHALIESSILLKRLDLYSIKQAKPLQLYCRRESEKYFFALLEKLEAFETNEILSLLSAGSGCSLVIT